MGFLVSGQPNGEAALHAVRREDFRAVLLDINMPRGGIETFRAIRELTPFLHVLMLTVRDQPESKIEALDAGADDLRHKAVPHQRTDSPPSSSRAQGQGAADSDESRPTVRSGELQLDVEKRQLRKAGELIRLTPKEFELLHYLMAHPGIPVTHVTLLRAVWGQSMAPRWNTCEHSFGNCTRKFGVTRLNPCICKRNPILDTAFLNLPDKRT